MKLERRAAAVLVCVALVAVPAIVLRVLCVGRSCDREERSDRKVPFCSLPAHTRDAIAAGYREGRSPEVMAVTAPSFRLVSDTSDPEGAVWPRLDDPSPTAPTIFWGQRIAPGAEIADMGLDDIGPSLARVIDLDIPHPEVRSGRPVVGAASGPRPRLLIELVIRGVRDIGSDPVLDGLRAEGAYGDADVGSLPLDPAALLTTIGTGGVPAQHGITGTSVRNDTARVAEAWRSHSLATGASALEARPPRSVIATLADDLDETLRQRPKVGLVADTHQARGLVGGNWYVDNDRDSLAIVPTRRVVPTLRAMLDRGFGDDSVPDLIGISLRATPTGGATPALHVLRVLEEAVGPRFTAVIVALPVASKRGVSFDAAAVASAVEEELGEDVVEADTAGGLFLDQGALASADITRDEVVAALANADVDHDAAADEVFADVFPGLAVAFARFC